MGRFFKPVLLALMLAFFHVIPIDAATFWINPTGSNAGTCGAEGSPCLDFDGLDADQDLSGGDTVCLENDSGIAVHRYHIDLDKVEFDNLTIDFQCAGQTNRAELRQPLSGSTENGLIIVDGVDDVTLTKPNINTHDGAGKRGIWVIGNSERLTITDPIISNIGSNGSSSSIGLDFGRPNDDGGFGHSVTGTVPTTLEDRLDPTKYTCQIFDIHHNAIRIQASNQGVGQSSSIVGCAVWNVGGNEESDAISFGKNGDNWTISDGLCMGGGEDCIDMGWDTSSNTCTDPGNAGSGGQDNKILRMVFKDDLAFNSPAPSGAYLTINGCQENTLVASNLFIGDGRAWRFYSGVKNVDVYFNTVRVTGPGMRMWRASDGIDFQYNLIGACVGANCDSFNRVLQVDAFTRRCCETGSTCIWKNNAVWAGGSSTELAIMDILGGGWYTNFCGSDVTGTRNETEYAEADRVAWQAADWFNQAGNNDFSWGDEPAFIAVGDNNYYLEDTDTVGRNKVPSDTVGVTFDFLNNTKTFPADLGALDFDDASGSPEPPPPPPPPATDDLMVLGTLVEASNATGTQDITITAFGGETPKAALFIATYDNTANSTARSFLSYSVGFYCGGDQRTSYGGDDDNVGTTQSLRGDFVGDVIGLFDGDASGSPTITASATQFIADGVRISWAGVSATNPEPQILVIMFTGDTVADCNVGAFKLPNDLGTPLDIDTVGFLASNVFTMSAGRLDPDINSQTADLRNSWGHVINDGMAIDQKAIAYSSDDEETTTLVSAGIYDNDFIHLNQGGGGDYIVVDASSFDVEGWTVASSVGNKRTGAFMAMKLADGVFPSMKIIDTATTTGTESYTGFGHEPQAVLLFATSLDTVSTDASPFTDSNDPGGVSWSFFDANGEEASLGIVADDDVGTSNTASRVEETALHLMTEAGATLIEASLTSLDADGFTLNYTTTDGTARKILAITWPVETSPPEPPPPSQTRRRRVGGMRR